MMGSCLTLIVAPFQSVTSMEVMLSGRQLLQSCDMEEKEQSLLRQ